MKAEDAGGRQAAKLNKHEIRSKATRTALLDGAEKIFFRDGFELAQIDAIAEEAGRTRGAVYAHYESKAHLFLSVIERRMQETHDRGKIFMAKETAAGLSEREAFRKYYIKLYEPAWAILMLEFKLYALRHPSELKKLRRMFKELLNLPVSDALYEMGPHASRLSKEVRFSGLMSMVSAVVLDMYFDPDVMKVGKARVLLGGVFDGLVSE